MLVVDTCTLSALYKLNLLPVLSFLFSSVLIPEAVQQEFYNREDKITVFKGFRLENGELDFPSSLIDDRELLRLGKGEREAIAWSLLTGSLLASDDLKARSVAKKKQILPIGTLGLLKLAYERGYFASKHGYIEAIDSVAKDLYVSQELLDWAKNI